MKRLIKILFGLASFCPVIFILLYLLYGFIFVGPGEQGPYYWSVSAWALILLYPTLLLICILLGIYIFHSVTNKNLKVSKNFFGLLLFL